MVDSALHRALYRWVRRGENCGGVVHTTAHSNYRWAWPPKGRRNQQHLGHLVRSTLVQWHKGRPIHIWTRTWCSGSIYSPDWMLGHVVPRPIVECEQCVLNHRKASLTESVGR